MLFLISKDQAACTFGHAMNISSIEAHFDMPGARVIKGHMTE